MSTPQFYSWDDDGSPGRALTGNLQNRLKQILVACLVNGYGSKPGAGWTLEHEHANGFTLSNGDAYVNFVSNLPANAPYPAMRVSDIHIYVAESLTDDSGAVIKGANLCSGPYRYGLIESAGYPRHTIYAAGALNSISSVQWSILATDKTFIISISPSSASAVDYDQFSIYAGRVHSDIGISDAFVVLAGINIAHTGDGVYPYTFTRGFSAPRSLLSGLAEYAVVGSPSYESRYNQYPRSSILGYVPAHMNLQPPKISVDGSYVGRLFGVAYDSDLSLYGWPAYLASLGFSGSDFADRARVVTVSNYQYAYCPAYAGGFIMTNDPAFW